MRSSSIWPENSIAAPPSTSSSQSILPPAGPTPHTNSERSNVFQLLARREVAPRTKRSPRRFWGDTSRCNLESSGLKCEAAIDARQELLSWVEAQSLLHLSANYCSLLPPPRSTIAAAFSPDGKTLASTHGDHTVKVIDCQTGKCLKVLSGHRRTPWVVRFHPLHPEVLASGSLDHEVRLWDANTAECIGSCDFYRPIASIAFHAEGEILAVASGHKLFIWNYNRRGEASSPTIILKTRRSLRAVHFHPHAAPFLLTAEVNDLDSSDPSMMLATSPGYLRYPPPTIYLADAHAARRSNLGNELPIMSIPFLIWPPIGRVDARLPSQHTDEFISSGVSQQRVDSSSSVRLLTYSTPSGQYELVLSPIESSRSHLREGSQTISSGSRTIPASGSGDAAAFNSFPQEQSSSQPFMSQVQSEVATSLAAAAAAELPCTVKLRIWSHTMENPSAHLETEKCRLTIPHAVLCSEMGAHFSPCGRFLAVCVACIQPNAEADSGFEGQVQHDVRGASTSPTRHPISAHQVMYELRVYSLEEATFGSVLASRAIRAAHCLTSIQFSPTSEHLLLAYGRRHISLLKSVVIDGDTTVPIYTILEIYKVSNMELVRVLPSAEDEVNVASFHPLVGGGLVYGTKEGKLRILQHDDSHSLNHDRSIFPNENMYEVPSYALEG
ncbi:WD40 YVTN repeat-like-containing domain-containing [Olea europaea subsp. europaea]|uniref:WD40 YVTN repeat-like-containing domain-containing n=1 Tax=Olea europaea subsp. europaea TaxID=158383 RepID=A0A8S0TWH3_OLEEU|nr:WD40 YVTN repeat-like-containing domain-containing [Olea europaea subsp. europaea]